jgi:hypothetical protein
MANIHNVVYDISVELFPNGEYNFEVKHHQNTTWYIYIRSPNSNRTGKIEIIIDGEDDIVGSVLRHGCVTRRTMATFMDTLLDRL